MQEVSSRVLVIHRGKLRAEGPPQDLVAQGVMRWVRINVRGTRDRLAQALDGLPGVTSREVKAGAGGTAAASLQFATGVDPGMQLGERLLAAGLPVIELHTELPTLEEFFHAITEGVDRAEEQAVAAAEPGVEVAR